MAPGRLRVAERQSSSLGVLTPIPLPFGDALELLLPIEYERPGDLVSDLAGRGAGSIRGRYGCLSRIDRPHLSVLIGLRHRFRYGLANGSERGALFDLARLRIGCRSQACTIGASHPLTDVGESVRAAESHSHANEQASDTPSLSVRNREQTRRQSQSDPIRCRHLVHQAKRRERARREEQDELPEHGAESTRMYRSRKQLGNRQSWNSTAR